MEPTSVYLHIPFCIHRCAYCDFNTYSGIDDLIPEYVAALIKEVEFIAASAPDRLLVHTLFFGGGTPSLLPAAEIERILSVIDLQFDLAEDIEITLEANPGTVTLDHLRDLRRAGINRLSLGMQSANPAELRLLERQHSFQDVLQAVYWSRTAGFEEINLDLIYGLPYQDLKSWKKNLNLAVRLNPDHLSLYALSLEHGTPMQKWVARGLLDEPDADAAADMYEWSASYLEQYGFHQYEISNWARVREDGTLLACQHNLQYWRLKPYLGVGAGAHGFIQGVHTVNVLSPGMYVQRLLEKPLANDLSHDESGAAGTSFPRSPATASAQLLDAATEMGEVMMMGLRLVAEGISGSDFRQRFGCDLEDTYQPQIETLVSQGLLNWDGETLRLTPRGRLLGNQVFMQFL